MKTSLKTRLTRLERQRGETLADDGLPFLHWADVLSDSPASSRRLNRNPRWWLFLADLAEDCAQEIANGEPIEDPYDNSERTAIDLFGTLEPAALLKIAAEHRARAERLIERHGYQYRPRPNMVGSYES